MEFRKMVTITRCTRQQKRHWCWEGLGAGGEGDDRGWDGWMASPTRWTWVWVNSGSWWWTESLACYDSWGPKESDTTERLNWTDIYIYIYIYIYTHTYKSIYNFILKRAWNLVEKRHVNINYSVVQCMKMWHKVQKKHRIWFNLFVLGNSLVLFFLFFPPSLPPSASSLSFPFFY